MVAAGLRRLPGRSGQRRLSEEEKVKLFRSHWALISAGLRTVDNVVPATPSSSSKALGPRRSSEPVLLPPPSRGAPEPLLLPPPSRGAGRRESTIDEEMEQVRGVLELILPTKSAGVLSLEKAGSEPSLLLPTVLTPPAFDTPGPPSPGGDAMSRPVSRNGEGAHHLEGTGKFQNQILERFRQQLLRRFLSLHDAFERLNHDVSRDRALTHNEFRNALERLGVGEQDSKAIFTAMDTHSVGGVTLSEFLHALVDVSPEALLWELRCRLIRFNIGPRTLNKALELVQWPQHGWLSRATKVKRRTNRRKECCACVEGCKPGVHCNHSPPRGGSKNRRSSDPFPAIAGPESGGIGMNDELAPGLDETSPKGRPPSYNFNRGEWLKLCTSMYLTLLEAERLFKYLADPEKDVVDLRAMFELLRTTVEPDVPLERFVTKAVVRYDSLENAFNTFCEDVDSINGKQKALRWPGFYSMAVALNVNDSCAAELWNVLSKSNLAYGRACDLSSGCGDFDESSGAISREVFLHELSLWAPDTALGELKGQLCERFGSLAEGQRALEDQLPQKEDFSPRDLEARIRAAAGIKNCDVEAALRAVAPKDGHVSLDAAISTMRAIRPRSRRQTSKFSVGARSTVRNQTQPLWEQLREVQTDMRRGCDWPANSRRGVGAEISLASKSTPPKAVDRRKFTEAIHGAVKSAESTRSRSVLHQAHRQVLKLEERWAGMPLSPTRDSAVVGRSRHFSIAGSPSPLASTSTGNLRSTAGRRQSASPASVPESEAS